MLCRLHLNSVLPFFVLPLILRLREAPVPGSGGEISGAKRFPSSDSATPGSTTQNLLSNLSALGEAVFLICFALDSFCRFNLCRFAVSS
jgi:hypothetical protein